MDQQRVDEEHSLIQRAGKELAQDIEQEGDGEEQTQSVLCMWRTSSNNAHRTP